MCGIFLHLNKYGIIRRDVMAKLMSLYQTFDHRGPDQHTLSVVGNCLLGFHRLSINDLSEKGNQPFELNGEFLMCNGEIYNYHEIQRQHNFPLKSKSDCEVLLHLFQKYGVKEGLAMIDGVFAMAYVTQEEVYLIRDHVGVKPLFYTSSFDNKSFTVASEPIGLDGMGYSIVEVLPATFMMIKRDCSVIETTEYFTFPEQPLHIEEEVFIQKVRLELTQAVRKRLCSDRPIGCLLSGGLDSSLIASILSREMKSSGVRLKTFSVGFPDSTDVVYARKVAQYLDTDHHEHIIDYTDAIRYIPTVISKLGSYDTTTIRASTPMFMLCEWITTNFPEKVIFSGEGSDEVFNGYLYSHNAPSNEELFYDSLRLVKNLYKYDVLRADRCTAGNGLEFREPFLDQDLLATALQIPGDLRKPRVYKGTVFEKYLLRIAFEGYLPEDVLWRRKAAFSDAVSSSEKPWYKWIQEYVETSPVSVSIADYGGTKESNYYKTLFTSIYKKYRPDIPLWLPQWSNTGQEPSATVLNVYKKDEH